ncbi:MAG: hypothetical protein P4L22_04005 [Candidatus Babeliales bacterium]|nr:hypothetical protein [Candidatus Babeliales bacterium]
MNIKNFILIMLITFNYQLYSSIGCSDNSYHMQRPNDMKEWHYVHCDCPCETILSERGECPRCRHYGNPKRGEFNALQKFDNFFR